MRLDDILNEKIVFESGLYCSRLGHIER